MLKAWQEVYFIRLYCFMITALATAVVVILVANAFTDNRFSASLLGDATFVAVLVVLIWRTGGEKLGPVGSVMAAVVAFIATAILLADTGGGLYFSAPIVGRALVHIFSIGYYPGGADAPFELGAMLWALSMLMICGLAMALAGGLQLLRQPQA